MNRTIFILGLVMFLTAVSSAVLINGDFDADWVADGTQINPPYTAWHNMYQRHAIYNPPSDHALQPRSGDNIFYTGVDWDGSMGAIGQYVTLTPGLAYRITGYVRRFPNNPYAGYVAALYDGVSVNSTAVGDMIHGMYGISQGVSGDTDEWTKFESPWYTVTPEDAGKTFQVQLYAWGGSYGTSFVCFDDVALEVIPEPATVALLSLGVIALRRRRV